MTAKISQSKYLIW